MMQVLNSQTKPQAARRSALEVRMAIMRVTAEGCTKPTIIMYRSNTSWMVLKKNLESLIALGFIAEHIEGSRTTYAVTDRGITVLRDYLNVVYLASV
jgi:predicted transcriptional regulator